MSIIDLLLGVGREFNGQIDRHDQELQALRQELAALRSELDDLRRTVNGHPEHGAVTKDHLVHQEIARRLDVLVNRSMVDAARQGGHGRTGGERELAMTVADLSALLFDPEHPDPTADDALGWLASRDVNLDRSTMDALLRVSRELKRMAHASGHRHEWITAATADVPLDAAWQRAWAGCDATTEIEMVVAPGYQVENTVYYRQHVFTYDRPTRRHTAPRRFTRTAVPPPGDAPVDGGAQRSASMTQA